jgi:hypothetical protein
MNRFRFKHRTSQVDAAELLRTSSDVPPTPETTAGLGSAFAAPKRPVEPAPKSKAPLTPAYRETR